MKQLNTRSNTLPSKDKVQAIKDQCDAEHAKELEARQAGSGDLSARRKELLYCSSKDITAAEDMLKTTIIKAALLDIKLQRHYIKCWEKRRDRLRAGIIDDDRYDKSTALYILGGAIGHARDKIKTKQKWIDSVDDHIDSLKTGKRSPLRIFS